METNNIKMYAKEVCKYGFDIASRIPFLTVVFAHL